MTYNDPTQVHSGECDECSCTVRDNETQLYPHGLKMVCWDCLETLEAEAAEEDDAPDSDRWLFRAADIVEVR